MGDETTAALLTDYADNAVRHRCASREGEFDTANSAADRLAEIVRQLRGSSCPGLDALVELLTDERIEVRGWAAAHCLEVDAAAAEAVLEDIAAGPKSLEEFSARMVLREWRAGSLKFP